jgi:hypothetical protein
MYRPTSKTKQRGGQYVSSATDFSAILAMSSIVFSTFNALGVSDSVMSTIEGRAGINPDQDITQLDVGQLSTLIKSIDDQIRVDNTLIGQNSSTIAGIDIEINTVPDGLQDQFNTADRNYISTQTALNRAASNYSTNLSTYIGRQAELALLGAQSSLTISSIVGYEAAYSTILRQLPSALQDYTTYSTTYGRQLENYNNYVHNYSTSIYNYNSTIQALTYNSSLFSVATYEYYSTSVLYSTLNADYSTYMRTVVSPAEFQLRSTQSYYSSIVNKISTQQYNLNSTIDVLSLAQIDLLIATSRKACEVATAVEVSTLVMLDAAKNDDLIITDQLLRDPNNTTLKQQKASADTTFFTLSTMAYYATQDRISKCINQSTISQTVLQSTLAYYDWKISTAAMYLADAMYRETVVISTISGITVNVAASLRLEGQIVSTMSSFSSLYIQEQRDYNYYSTIVAGYDYNSYNLSTQLISTLSVLQYFINFSTMYSYSTGIYRNNYATFSTSEGYLRMSIASYELQRSSLTSSILGIDVEISGAGGLDSQISDELLNLTTNGPNFYIYKKQEMNDEIDEYKYSISEISATVGMTVGDLVIKKMDNLDTIDRNNLSLTLNSQSLTIDQQTARITENGQKAQQNSQIDRILIRLNPLEIKFRELLQLVEDERNLKTGTGGFIDAKAQLFNDELNYYRNNGNQAIFASLIAGGYNTRFKAMNDTLALIRDKMLKRDNKYKEIRDELRDVNVRDLIYTILGGDQRFPDTENATYIGVIITADTEYKLDELRNPATLSEYSIIPSLPDSQ